MVNDYDQATQSSKPCPQLRPAILPKQPTELPATQRRADITITRDEGKPTTSLISRLAVKSLNHATFNPRLRHRRRSNGNTISFRATKASDGSENPSTYVIVGSLFVFIPLLIGGGFGLIRLALLHVQSLPSLTEHLADLT